METIIKSPAIAAEVVKLWPGLTEQSTARPAIVTYDHAPETAALNERLDDSQSLTQEPLADDESSVEAVQEPKDETPPSFQQFWDAHHETLQALETKTRQEGYEQGFSKGEAAAQQVNQDTLEKLHQVVEQGQAAMARVVKDAEELIGAIVFEAVCKIVGEQLLQKDGCQKIVSRVIQDTLDENILQIKISPKDFEKLQASRHETETTFAAERLAKLPIQADSTVELGGCRVELKDGQIDGRIETQFRLFAQSLKEAISQR